MTDQRYQKQISKANLVRWVAIIGILIFEGVSFFEVHYLVILKHNYKILLAIYLIHHAIVLGFKLLLVRITFVT